MLMAPLTDHRRSAFASTKSHGTALPRGLVHSIFKKQLLRYFFHGPVHFATHSIEWAVKTHHAVITWEHAHYRAIRL